MSTERETVFGIVSKLGGSQRVLDILDAMGEEHVITRRAMNHWYNNERRRVSGTAAMSLTLAAKVMNIAVEPQDFFLDEIDFDAIAEQIKSIPSEEA